MVSLLMIKNKEVYFYFLSFWVKDSFTFYNSDSDFRYRFRYQKKERTIPDPDTGMSHSG